MATVKVGSARLDENGKTHGGKAGDQNKKEVSSQNYYVHPKGWRVFRAVSREVALKIAKCMEMACANSKIGYDQYQRNTLYTKAEPHGFDVSKVTSACETDCSALVRVCCAFAGIMGLPSGFRTGNMPANLLKTGAFIELKGSKYQNQSAYLGKGDILVTKTNGHTVVVLTDGSKYEGDIAPKEYELGERILRNGDEGPDVKAMQEYLIQLGYDLGKWGADGDFGDATELAVMKFQKEYGLEADGEYGPKSHAALMQAIEDEKQPDPGIASVRIEGGDCFVRAEPNTGGRKLGVAYEGDVLPYGGQTEGGWHLVEFKSENGWVSGKYGKLMEG